MTILKPRDCPFCGSADLGVADREDLKDWVYMYCKNCKAYANSLPKSYPTLKEGLIFKWNRRAYKHD